MGKLQRSWSIFKKSLALIGTEKKLLVFPLISFCAIIVLFVLICGGTIVFLISSPDAVAASNGNNADTVSSIFELLLFFICYFLAMFVSNFCSTAFFSEIFIGLHGGNVSIRRGLHTAKSRLKALILWTLLASTVGVLLKVLEKKFGVIGKIVIQFIGAAWAVVSCFSIPAIALDSELVNPFNTLKRSAESIRKTWGESLAGFLGIGLLNWIAILLVLPVFIASILLICVGCNSPAFILAGVLLLVGTIIGLSLFAYLLSVAQTVYRAALFLYADGEHSQIFTDEELQGAFSRKS